MGRHAAVAGSLLLAVLLATGCSTGMDAPAPTPPVTPTSPAATAVPSGSAAPASPGAAAPASPGAAAPNPAVRQITLTVSGRSVTGDTGLVALRVGEPAQVTVTSDVADEVHVHGSGAGVGREVPAGGTVTIAFTETAPGRYEIELERARRTLTRLQVR